MLINWISDFDVTKELLWRHPSSDHPHFFALFFSWFKRCRMLIPNYIDKKIKDVSDIYMQVWPNSFNSCLIWLICIYWKYSTDPSNALHCTFWKKYQDIQSIKNHMQTDQNHDSELPIIFKIHSSNSTTKESEKHWLFSKPVLAKTLRNIFYQFIKNAKENAKALKNFHMRASDFFMTNQILLANAGFLLTSASSYQFCWKILADNAKKLYSFWNQTTVQTSMEK